MSYGGFKQGLPVLRPLEQTDVHKGLVIEDLWTPYKRTSDSPVGTTTASEVPPFLVLPLSSSSRTRGRLTGRVKSDF